MVGSISLRLITYVAAKINIISESSKTISLKMSCNSLTTFAVADNELNHTFALFLLRISSLAARISALISSSESSRSLLDSAALLCCINKSSALGDPLIVKGMLRLLITAFTKMLNAVFALMPNCSQSASNCVFISESILTVTADCAIVSSLLNST